MDDNWNCLIYDKILESIVNKKISTNTLEIAKEINNLNLK